ncbi:MAG: YncE family protein [Actinomycetota bacterium]|nr:YncE family protein [Actinomycetota bacterium]
MRSRNVVIATVVAVVVIGAVVALVALRRPDPLSGFNTVRDVRLPGDTSRFDYQSFDPQKNLLFIAHLGASEIVVYDTSTNHVVRTIDGVSDVHGVLALPSLNKVYATATGRNELDVIDERSFRVVDSIPTGDYPDGLAYDSRDDEIFVSNEAGASDTVVDARHDRVAATIHLGGEVGNTQYDATSGLIYVAVQTTRQGQLVAIDPRSESVVDRMPLPGCDGAHGVYLDPVHEAGFVACEDNSTLVLVDLRHHEAVSSFSVGDRPDVLAFDPPRHRLYIASESGVLTVFAWEGSNVTKLDEGFAGPNAHSVAVDPATGLIFLPLTNVGGHPVLRELTRT